MVRESVSKGLDLHQVSPGWVLQSSAETVFLSSISQAVFLSCISKLYFSSAPSVAGWLCQSSGETVKVYILRQSKERFASKEICSNGWQMRIWSSKIIVKGWVLSQHCWHHPAPQICFVVSVFIIRKYALCKFIVQTRSLTCYSNKEQTHIFLRFQILLFSMSKQCCSQRA